MDSNGHIQPNEALWGLKRTETDNAPRKCCTFATSKGNNHLMTWGLWLIDGYIDNAEQLVFFVNANYRKLTVNFRKINIFLNLRIICGDSRSKQHHLGTIHCFHTFFIACWRQRYTFIRVGADRIQLRACLRQRQLVRNCRRKSFPSLFANRYYILSIIKLFASSILDVWIEARYICVVVSESWPMAPLIPLMGTLKLCAMLAQLWRAT